MKKSRKLIASLSLLTFSALVLGACSPDKKVEDKTSASSAKVENTKASSEKSTEKEEAKAPEKIAGGDLKDGTYKLEEKNESNGYRAVFEMVVKDGKIAESNYDNINKDGKSKKDDADYEKNMKAKSGVGPAEFIPQLNESFVNAQNASGVEIVTGATHSAESFQNYAQQLIQAAQAGNTETIYIDNGAPLKDGTYTLKEKNDSNGYHVDFTMVVKDGKVAESKYDNLSADGKSKKDDTEYEKAMKDKNGVGPAEFIDQLNENFLKAMSGDEPGVANTEIVTGATHSSHSFVSYAQQLINAAEKGDTAVIEVDNIVTK